MLANIDTCRIPEGSRPGSLHSAVPSSLFLPFPLRGPYCIRSRIVLIAMRTEKDIRKAADPVPHGHFYFLCVIRYVVITPYLWRVPSKLALLLKQHTTMKTPSCFWLPLTVSALITNVLAQALGADPSIQAPGATIPINTTLTVKLFGTLPPFLVQLVQSGSNIVVQVIGRTPRPMLPKPL